MKQRPRLFVFDMDGTLLHGTTACAELASAIPDTAAALEQIEAAFASGEIDTVEFAQKIHTLWGVLDHEFVEKVFRDAPKLANIDQAMGLLKSRGDMVCMITMSPEFFARHFSSLGVDRIFASQFPETSVQTLHNGSILTPEDKPTIVSELCSDFGFDLGDVVAFGDSMSDWHLFRQLQHTVAVNADRRIRALARYVYDGDDLLEALRLVDSTINSLEPDKTGDHLRRSQHRWSSAMSSIVAEGLTKEDGSTTAVADSAAVNLRETPGVGN